MRLTFAALSMLALLPAGVSAQRALPPVRTIAFETSPCFGACPVYRVTVNRHGLSTFTGIRFTRVVGRRAFRVTPAQFAAFERQLAPLRPAGERIMRDQDQCASIATDMPSVDVVWQAGRATSHLNYYFGCDMEKNRDLATRLRKVSALLPIASLIGKH